MSRECRARLKTLFKKGKTDIGLYFLKSNLDPDLRTGITWATLRRP